ncbi:disintegrin and metalloproteinase domain-containing protein 21-like [Mesocricetus auratus]|uniref:Disintegrin and metalloproteinase domain-containing protein 21-like n=1 Tax=Mesocricetus auratus TaxID=10036 RepID=A0A1U7QID6_MESAU|nr:disintegrin and metalloproteinase domain-containing protein 21-like [Mesocricetus auratus]
MNFEVLVLSASPWTNLLWSMAPFLRSSTWTQVLLGGSLWLSVLWVLLYPVYCSRGPPKWRFATSEVVIPRKVPQRMGGSDTPDQITYSMRFRGQRHVVHMKLKKNMIPENFPVYTTNDQGAEQEEHPFVPRDCYFYSYLEGVPGSLATLDTCNGGLNGMLQVDDFTYEIKPLASSSKFEHVISLLVVERSHKSKKCRNEETVPEADESLEETKLAGSPRAAPVYLWRVHVKVLRVHYTMTSSLTTSINNFTASLEMVLTINSIADSIYKLTGLAVFPVAICLWDRGADKLSNVHSPDRIPEVFFQVKQHMHNEIKISVSVVLTGHKIGGLDYAAPKNGLCKSKWGVAYTHVENRHAFLAATIMSHALGHSIGLDHDTVGCVCFRRSRCVMNEFPALLDMMSNCSQAVIHDRIHGWDECLSFERSQYSNFKYIVPRCGDKKVNEHEECDCGTFKECANNKCCSTNCQFSQGSTCNIGGCCKDCVYAPIGHVCRDKLGICDLPEYCDGTSQNCPENFYIQDGTPCSPLAVCMSGNCSDRDLQCQALFGYEVKDASPACYKQLNLKGDRFGNCGVKLQRGGSQPLPCQDDGIYCGLLHCDGVTRVPGGGEHTTFHHIKVQDIKEEQCFGYDAHHGTEIPEMGLVVDGATCGPGKYCKAQACVFHQHFNFKCNLSFCNYRGVCNNKGHCHCVQGWRPPDCEQRGTGGSADSGPTISTKDMFRAKIHVSVNRILIVLFTRMVLILVSLIFGALTRAVMIVDLRQERLNARRN